MSTDQEEVKRLDVKIKQHDARLSQLRNLPGYEHSPNLLAEVETELRERERAISERMRLKQLIQIRDDLRNYDQKIVQQERIIQRHQEQLEAAQRAMERAEAELVVLRIDRQKRQTQLDEMQQPNPAAFEASPMPATAPPTHSVVQSVALLLNNGVKIVLHPNQSEWILGREGVDANFSSYDSQGVVSRRHARINYSAGQWSMTDLDSTNGTWVGSMQLQPHVPMRIEHGALIKLGGLMVTFVVA